MPLVTGPVHAGGAQENPRSHFHVWFNGSRCYLAEISFFSDMTVGLNGYEAVAEAKAASLLASIPQEWQLETVPSVSEVPNADAFADTLLSPKELAIVNMSAKGLIKAQEKGELTALAITNAYSHRAAIVHQLTQCCTEIFFDRAQKSAEELDAYFRSTGKLRGKLHGIPISLKDQINLPGIDTAIGYLGPYVSEEIQKKITHRKSLDDESLIALVLASEGAVFYVKSTVPMAMLAGETASNFGITKNSLDRRMAPGGSSGGEGALLGAKASIIGIGTDIGGSIRIPSTVHGLYGLRGSSNRFPYLDIANSYPNQTCVCSVVGPMCRFAEDLALVSEAILNSPLCIKDPKWIPIPWRQEAYQSALEKDLKVGIMKWDGELLPQPPILNRLNKLPELFDQRGIEWKNVELSEEVSFAKLTNVLLGFYMCDNFEEIKAFCELGGEPLSDLIKRSFNLPNHVDTLAEYMERVGQKYELQQLMDAWWDRVFQGMDCVILPAYTAPNWVIGEQGKVSCGYTRSINVLDYTAITVPVGTVEDSDDTWEREDFTSAHDKEVWEYYDKAKMLGKPIALQIVCKRYEEEKAIALAERVGKMFRV